MNKTKINLRNKLYPEHLDPDPGCTTASGTNLLRGTVLKILEYYIFIDNEPVYSISIKSVRQNWVKNRLQDIIWTATNDVFKKAYNNNKIRNCTKFKFSNKGKKGYCINVISIQKPKFTCLIVRLCIFLFK